MPWVRIDDHIDEHPKVAALSDSAFALFVTSLAYCNRNLTDGFVPNAVGLGKLRWCEGNTIPPIRELEASGLWEEANGGWQIHDYEDFQPSREDVLKEREAARERKAKSRKKSQPKSQGDSQEESPNGHGGSSALPVPVPNPVPNPETETPKKRSRKTALPKDFAPNGDVLQWAKENHPTVDAKAETLRFIDYHRANGSTFNDWLAAWRNWIRNAEKFNGGRRPVSVGAADDKLPPL